jgi:hypothetical protein
VKQKRYVYLLSDRIKIKKTKNKLKNIRKRSTRTKKKSSGERKIMITTGAISLGIKSIPLLNRRLLQRYIRILILTNAIGTSQRKLRTSFKKRKSFSQKLVSSLITILQKQTYRLIRRNLNVNGKLADR